MGYVVNMFSPCRPNSKISPMIYLLHSLANYLRLKISAAALVAEVVTTQQSAMPKGHTRFTMRVGDGVPKKPVVPHRCYRRERLDREKELKSRIRCNSHSEALRAVAEFRALSVSVAIVVTTALFWIFRDR